MTGTKDRILDSSAELFRRQGYTGTGMKQIVAEASAPFGSIYHFFPGGKEQLGAEAIRHSGALYGQLIGLFFVPGADPVSATESFFAGAAATLVETDYADACPIATVALEVAATNEPLRKATADVFTAWIDAGTERFARFGLGPEAARTLTITAVNNLEGAFVLCRSLQDTEAMAVAGAATVDVARRLLRENTHNFSRESNTSHQHGA